MDLRLLQVLILCVCLGQIRTDSGGFHWARKKFIRGAIYGVSEQFVDNYVALYEKYLNDTNIFHWLNYGVEFIYIRNSPKYKNTKLDVNNMKDLYMTKLYTKRQTEIAMEIDNMKIIQTILSKQLQPEQYNGVVNFFYMLSNANTTSEEIEITLVMPVKLKNECITAYVESPRKYVYFQNYLYGVDTEATKTSFLDAHNFPDLSADDCPKLFQNYADAVDRLKTLVGINPKVIQDLHAIHKAFPCSLLIYIDLREFVDHIEKFPNDACKIKNQTSPNHSMLYGSGWQRSLTLQVLQSLESTFSLRLPDETYRGLFNYMMATIPAASMDEIQTALEYLYIDVSPKTECPENSTLKSE